MRTVRIVGDRTYAGPRGVVFQGGTIEVSEGEAQQLIRGGYAEEVLAQPNKEEIEKGEASDDEGEQIPPDDSDKVPETTSDYIEPENTAEATGPARRRRDPAHREHTRRPEPKLASGDPPKPKD